MPGPPRSGRLRHGRTSRPGGLYHITKCSLPCLPISLADGRIAPTLIDSIHWHHEQGHALLRAFVVMEDHVHWLFTLGSERSLQDVMHGFGSFTWQCLHPVLPDGLTTLWQRDFHDHQLRPGESARAKAAYIHGNPVRHGLCDAPEHWPWSTASQPYRNWVVR